MVRGVRVGARFADDEDDMVTALRSEDGVAEDKSGSARIEFGSSANGDDLVMSATASSGASQCLWTGCALNIGGYAKTVDGAKVSRGAKQCVACAHQRHSQ